MRKMRLDVDDLRVDSFGTAPDARHRSGTVRGRAASDFTDCWGGCGGTENWGGCGGESEGVFGCGGGSEGCTLNPYDDNCFSYAQQCPYTVIPGATCHGTCGAPGGDSVCGGAFLCTDGCTV